MKTPNHTELKVSVLQEKKRGGRLSETVMIGDGTNFWADCGVKTYASIEKAQFIVNACNAHYDLVHSLRELLANGGTLSDPVSRKKAQDRARSALAKAQGKD